MGGIELNLDIYKNVQMMWQRMDGGYGGNVKRTDHRHGHWLHCLQCSRAHCCAVIIPSHSSSSLVPVPAKFQLHWSCTNMTITAQRPSICTWTLEPTQDKIHIISEIGNTSSLSGGQWRRHERQSSYGHYHFIMKPEPGPGPV